MSDQKEQPPVQTEEPAGGTATKTRPAPQKPPTRLLPPWKVLLHNDDVNDELFVVETIMMLTAIGREQSVLKTLEAHETGVSLLLTTHQERAELYRDQFTSRGLTVTIEPGD